MLRCPLPRFVFGLLLGPMSGDDMANACSARAAAQGCDMSTLRGIGVSIRANSSSLGSRTRNLDPADLQVSRGVPGAAASPAAASPQTSSTVPAR
jgi:hypothetical protein